MQGSSSSASGSVEKGEIKGGGGAVMEREFCTVSIRLLKADTELILNTRDPGREQP